LGLASMFTYRQLRPKPGRTNPRRSQISGYIIF
jgi:hypothetical protein